MSTVELSIPATELEVGDVIVNRFGAREITFISRTVYTTFYRTEHCIECSCSNLATITIRRSV
jgi:hypothetical protein